MPCQAVFVPFPLMENEPKRSSASRCSDRRLAQPTAPRSEVGAKPRWKRRKIKIQKKIAPRSTRSLELFGL